MAHPHLAKDLETLKGELKVHLSAVPFELDQVTHFPSQARSQILRPEHEGCYLGVTQGGTTYNTIDFGLGLDLSTWGKPEVLYLSGRFIDMRFGGDRYERWYFNPTSNPYMLDIFDRVDRMAAYALRLLEKYAQESLTQPDFQLFSSLPSEEIYAVVDYFRMPVQIDYKG
jgi:hypothetical protein